MGVVPKATAKASQKAGEPTFNKLPNLSFSLVVAVLAVAIGFYAGTHHEPIHIKATVRDITARANRWRIDREILRKTDEMGGIVYSYNPLVIYLPNFINKTEIDYLAELGQRDAEPSLVFQYDGEDDQLVDEDTRKSKSALLPFSDPLVRAVAERTQNFQGYDDIRHLESLQVVSYDQSDHFWHHMDYFQDSYVSEANGFNRDTTMLIYLEDNCTGGGTNFPELPMPEGEMMSIWASKLEFNATYAEIGPTFRPIAGSAIFWRNFNALGKGYQQVIHAGLPVESGHKSAVNVWTAQTPVLGDSSAGIVCPDEEGNMVDCAWDDPTARPGIPIEYSSSYWVQEGEAYRAIFEQADVLYGKLNTLAGAKASAEEKKELHDQIKEIEDTVDEATKNLHETLETNPKKQVELQNLIKELEEAAKNRPKWNVTS